MNAAMSAAMNPSLEALEDLTGPDTAAQIATLRRSLRHESTGLAQLVAALPSEVSALCCEVALELSRLTRALSLHHPQAPIDIEKLTPLVRVHWRQTQLIGGDDTWVEDAEDSALAEVFATPFKAPSAAKVLGRLTRAEDPRLRRVVLRDLAACVANLSLHPSEALPLILALNTDEDEGIRAEGVRLLAAPWLVSLTDAGSRRRLRALENAADAVDEVACAALDAAAVLAHSPVIRERFADEGASVTVRKCALSHLGATGDEDLIAPMLALALQDPLAYASTARDAILRMHRRGVFVREEHLPALLALYDGLESFTGPELLRVSHLVRHSLLKLLAATDRSDKSWVRRADILAHSFGTGAHLLLERLLESLPEDSDSDIAIAAALIDAAASSAEFTACTLALPFYDALPERVLALLRVKGDDSHVPLLLKRVCHPSCPRTLRVVLIEVLWTLALDRESLLRTLVAALGPHEALRGRSKSRQDTRVATLLAKAPWPDTHEDLETIERLEIFAASGDIRLREALIEEFRLAYRRCLAKALGGDFSTKREGLPELEQQLFIYGRHLVSDGRRVRPWQHASPETGRDFVLEVLCEWLREVPDDAVIVALLESIGRQAPSGPVLRFIEPYWRHRNPGVQRAALEAILASTDDHGLELSISQLSDKASDTRVLVQALRGIATLGADWAAPMAARCLEHPNMSVKKEAAETLASLDPGAHAAAISEQLVMWLGRHDNSGFRVVLKRALRQCAGPMQVACLVLAAEDSEEPRTMTLLCDALSGLVDKDMLLRLARDSRLPELIDACLRGETRVADATKSELAALLHRAFPEADHTGTEESAVYRLEVHGFSVEDATEALAEHARCDVQNNADTSSERDDSEALRNLARNNLAPWLAWHAELRDGDGELVSARCAALLVDAAPPVSTSKTVSKGTANAASKAAHEPNLYEVAESLAALLSEDGRLQSSHDDEARSWAKSLLDFVDARTNGEERPRLIRLLRSLGDEAPVQGLRRFRMLRKLGAVRSQADLERSLRQSARGPSYQSESVALLTEAFAVPPKSDHETEAQTKLREAVDAFSGLHRSAQQKWLDDTCARRPIGVALLPDAPRPKRRAREKSRAALDTLLQVLGEEASYEYDAQEAASRILAWDEARHAWPAVLRAYLQGRIAVPRDKHVALAHLMERWPTDDSEQRRAAKLITGLWVRPEDAELRRRLIQEWIVRWRAGDEDMLPLLRSAGGRLLPFVEEAFRQGDRSLVTLLPAGHVRFLHHLGAEHPEVARALAESQIDETEPASDSLEDPLAGLDIAGLAKLAGAKDTVKGLAVRAVHALSRIKDSGAIDALETLTHARQPSVRSAALRFFHRLADKERAMRVSFEVLQLETRSDVVLSLMRRLAHAHYAPALPLLIERLSHHDSHMRQHAHRALLAWGSDAAGPLRHSAKKARPDRRPALLALAAELET